MAIDDYYDLVDAVTPSQAVYNNYYSSVPQSRYPALSTPIQDPSVGIPDRMTMQIEYENQIINGLRQVDSSGDDYEMKLQEYFADIEDPNALSYPRVQAAAQAALKRYNQGKSKAEEYNDLKIKLAQKGLPPERLAEMEDERGNFDPIRAAYALGELERFKIPEKPAVNEKDLERIMPVLERAKTPPSDVEMLQWIAANTNDPKILKGLGSAATEEDMLEWARKNSKAISGYIDSARAGVIQSRVEEADSLFNILEAAGRDMSKFRNLLPKPSQPAEVDAAPMDTSNATAVPPTSRFLSASEARAAREEAARQRVNDAWTTGKNNVRDALVNAVDLQPNEAPAFWELLRNNAAVEATDDIQDTTAPAGELSGFSVDLSGPRTAPAIDEYLRRAGINPNAIEPNTKRKYRDVAKALADDMVRTDTSVLKTSSGTAVRPVSQ